MSTKLTADKVLTKAKSQVRDKSYGSNNKYTKWYYGKSTSAAWCGIFVKYVIEKLCEDKELLCGCTNFAYVPTVWNWAKSKGYLKSKTYTPQAGDLVIFDWTVDNELSRDHIGFVICDRGTYISTVEGNTSSVSQGNGGCVQLRERNKKYVAGYVRLPYAKPKVTKKKYSGALPKNTVKKDCKNKEEVKEWQEFLNWALDLSLVVDGICGPKTVDATKKFQKLVGITCDGICGKNTLSKAKGYKK